MSPSQDNPRKFRIIAFRRNMIPQIQIVDFGTTSKETTLAKFSNVDSLVHPIAPFSPRKS
jgi:hypothetical protein